MTFKAHQGAADCNLGNTVLDNEPDDKERKAKVLTETQIKGETHFDTDKPKGCLPLFQTILPN